MSTVGYLALAHPLLAVAVWLLHKFAALKLWHGLICVLFGFYLASSSARAGDPHHRHQRHPRPHGPATTRRR